MPVNKSAFKMITSVNIEAKDMSGKVSVYQLYKARILIYLWVVTLHIYLSVILKNIEISVQSNVSKKRFHYFRLVLISELKSPWIILGLIIK